MGSTIRVYVEWSKSHFGFRYVHNFLFVLCFFLFIFFRFCGCCLILSCCDISIQCKELIFFRVLKPKKKILWKNIEQKKVKYCIVWEPQSLIKIEWLSFILLFVFWFISFTRKYTYTIYFQPHGSSWMQDPHDFVAAFPFVKTKSKCTAHRCKWCCIFSCFDVPTHLSLSLITKQREKGIYSHYNSISKWSLNHTEIESKNKQKKNIVSALNVSS